MIEYYNLKGEFIKGEKLTRTNLDTVNGMKIRCTLKNGEIIIGFGTTSQNLSGENIEINCSFDYQYGFRDVRKVHWTEIDKIEAMLYSNPRWGRQVDFSFNVNKSKIED